MRRWLGRLAVCCLLAIAASGCHHTAGKCDCDPGHCPLGAYGGYMGPTSAPLDGPVITTPGLKTAPMTKVNE